jgi:septum formation protein
VDVAASGSAGLVLASRSPQRRAILEQLGVAFTVAPTTVEECAAGDPAEVAEENARRKARAARGGCVLGADTVVAAGGRLLPKPADVAQARAWLELLSGATHEVVGGLCVAQGGVQRTAITRTLVTFRRLDEADLAWYLASREWCERAGGYAIQGRGAALVARIEGEYLNVVGLSVTGLLSLLPGLLTGRAGS